MNRIVVLAAAAVFALGPSLALAQQPPAPSQNTGAIQGTAQGSDNKILPDFTVQIRSVETGQVVATTKSDAKGAFTVGGLPTAAYVIEVVNQAGAIVATSSAIGVTAGATVTVTVTASVAAAVAGTTAAAAAAAAAAGAGAAAGISTAVIVTAVAAAAGVTGAVVAANQGEASPAR